jgi:cellulose synthase/poly-beta-1,6-N-acetylglucosamine synthase-like glycosyltransferase
VKFVSGGVRIRGDGSVWSGLQATEFVSLIGTGAATIGLGYPTLCNGANMAFRRDVFNEVGGYAGNEHIASGDDEFLIRKVHLSYPGGVRFCSDAATVVETTAVPFREFISQRLRWAGKWKHHRSFPGLALAVFIFSFHAAFLTILPAVVIAGAVIIPLVLIAGKMLLEYLFLRRVSAFLGTGWSWTRFGVLQVTYPLYAVLFGIFANLKSPVWKGRKIRRGAREIHTRLVQNR